MKYYFGILITIFAVILAHFIYVMISSVGGARNIKAYKYPVTKSELEKVINTILKENKNVHRDTIVSYSFSAVDSATGNPKTNSSLDSVMGSVRDTPYYNDGTRYITIYISKNGSACKYTFQFSATEHWDTTSGISIFYAWDENNDGGSEGHGDFVGKPDLKTELTRLFESEFIDKIDKQLGKVHTEPD